MSERTPHELMYPCQIFRRAGRPTYHCGTCRRPYWDHLFEAPRLDEKPLFRVRQGNGTRWEWKPVGRIITRSMADVIRHRHGPR